MCARCCVEFPGRYAFQMLWCTVDRFYVCHQCWRTGCGEGHGQGAKAMRFRTWRFFALIAITVLALAVAAPLASDYATLSRWQQTPIFPISSLVAGQTVRIQGVMTGTGPVAFGTNEFQSCDRYGNCNWQWTWNDTDTFSVQDTSGQILVTVTRWWVVTNGPHPATYLPDVRATYYAPGDAVCIMGMVQQAADGSRTLAAFIVSRSTNIPAPSTEALGFLL